MFLRVLPLLGAACAVLSMAGVTRADYPGPATYNQAWSSTFERNEVGEPGDNWCDTKEGFHFADGGFSAYHAASGATFWVFGDTSNYDDAPFQANTIAKTLAASPAWSAPIQSGSPASDIRFYARAAAPPLYDVLVDQTAYSFRNAPFVVSSNLNKWYWPGAAIIPSNTTKLITYWTRVKCPNSSSASHPRSCYKTCNLETDCPPDMNPDDGIEGDRCVPCDQWPHTLFGDPANYCQNSQKWCRTALQYGYDKPQKVCEVANVSAAPESWPPPTCTDIQAQG